MVISRLWKTNEFSQLGGHDLPWTKDFALWGPISVKKDSELQGSGYISSLIYL